MPIYTEITTSAQTANTQTTGSQDNTRITALSGNRFLLTWTTNDTTGDGSATAIKGRIFDSVGNPLGSEFLVNGAVTGEQREAVVSRLPDGGFVIAWTTLDAAQDGSFAAIKARVYDASGIPTGSEFLVNTLTVNDQQRPTITTLANGNFVIGWSSSQPVSGGTFGDVKAQIFNPAGTKIGSEFLVNTLTTDPQDWAHITALDNGNFVATWQSGFGSNIDIRAQIFSATGAKVGFEFGVNSAITGIQSGAQAAKLPGGGFIIVWITTDTAQDGSGYAIKAQAFNATGAKVGTEILVNTTTAGNQSEPSVAALDDGTVLVSWSLASVFAGGATGANSAIVGQIIDSSGAKIGTEFVIQSNVANLEHSPALAVLDNGSLVAAWTDIRNFGVANNPDIAFRVYDALHAPELGAPSQALTIAEGLLAVGTIAASDADGDPIIYSITGGLDAARFAINASTGALSFVSPPDFEAPTDTDSNNVYQVIVTASDGSLADSQTVFVSVTNINETPTITSPASFSMGENTLAAGVVIASDPDGTAPAFAITGGADAAHFAIDAVTGALSLVSAPNFEAPGDADADNVYDLVVTASDGALSASQAIAVTVTNGNDVPVITSMANFSAAENAVVAGTVTAGDPDGDALTYAIAGGADAALFAIDAGTGVLSFISAPDFESPTDAGADNIYDVVVTASDGTVADTQALSITVTNVNEAPTITSSAGQSAVENTLIVGTVTAGDPEADALTYAIVGGADAALFAIDAATGVLSFVAAPDFEAPGDADGDNIYRVTIQASDGSLGTIQAVEVSLTNANEAPVITSQVLFSISENSVAAGVVAASDPEGSAVTYAITGGADALRFTIDAATGALAFVTAPNFEAPGDTDGDNAYEIIVTASDGALSSSQSITVTVGNVNEAPVITSNGGGATAAVTVNENTTTVATIGSTDPEGTARTYAIVGGADAAKFTINATTGALSFVTAPNWEAPTDNGANNVYDVVVQASDGSLADTQALAITVANVVDGVTLTGTSKANTLTGTVAEDTINGLGGNDTLNGGAGADTINGGDGADQIIGGAGADVLTGGAGNDTFVYQSLSDSTLAVRDFITDFAAQDKISLSAIDANSLVGGDQAFAWIGTAAFSNVAGQLRTYQQNGNTFVTGDVNGDGVGDFVIEMDPLLTLAANNFIL